MSLFAPRTLAEGKFQYCNYGYDSTKFKSLDDCMTNYDKVFNVNTNSSYNPNTYKVNISEEQKALEKEKQQVVLEEKRLLELQNQPTQSFLEKHKNYLLIAGAVVLGFLAYKKFKK